jgi:hypothetical protein
MGGRSPGAAGEVETWMTSDGRKEWKGDAGGCCGFLPCGPVRRSRMGSGCG